MAGHLQLCRQSVLVGGGGGSATLSCKTSIDAVLEGDLAEVQSGLVIAVVGIAVSIGIVGVVTGGVGFGLGHVDGTGSRRVGVHARGELVAIGLHARQVDVGHIEGADHRVSIGKTGKAEGSSQSGGRNNRFETHFSQPL